MKFAFFHVFCKNVRDFATNFAIFTALYGLILFFLLLGRPARFDDAQSLETFINTFTLPSPAISLTSNGFDGGKSN